MTRIRCHHKGGALIRRLVPLEESRKRGFPLLSFMTEHSEDLANHGQEPGPCPVTRSAGTLTSDFLASSTEN